MEKEKCSMCGKEVPVEEVVVIGSAVMCADCAQEAYHCLQMMEQGMKLW